MARTDTLGNFLTDVAIAIRNKKGTTDTIVASNFDFEIVSKYYKIIKDRIDNKKSVVKYLVCVM